MQNNIDQDDSGPAEADRLVAAVTAALAILDSFEEDMSLRLKDLHERTGMQKSRIMRLAGSLSAAGYLVTEKDGGGYRLGPRIHALGLVVAGGSADLATKVRSLLVRLSLELDDTCFFSVVRGTQRLILAQAAPERGLRFMVREGQLRPLHVGATGKVLLAFGPQSLRERILGGELVSLTASTTIDAETLAAEFAHIRKLGYSVSRGEATSHAYALAVPLLDENDTLLGTISIAGPSSKLSPEQEAPLAETLRAGIREVGFFTSLSPIFGGKDHG